MNDLRNGVKLKKTNFTKTPIEYALTPYEMLMDDIRSRRYNCQRIPITKLYIKISTRGGEIKAIPLLYPIAVLP